MSSTHYVREENQEPCNLYSKFYEVIAKMQNLRQWILTQNLFLYSM